MVREMGLEITGARSMGCAQPAASAAPKNTAGKNSVRFIVSALRVHRIERWGRGGSPLLKNGVDRGQDGQRGKRGDDQPANHRTAERRRLRSALTEADRHRDH